jgi:hypothetical protein
MQELLESELNVDHLLDYITAVVSTCPISRESTCSTRRPAFFSLSAELRTRKFAVSVF